MLAPGSDRIPVELFQILKDEAVESAALNMQYALNMLYAGSRHLRLLIFLPAILIPDCLSSSPTFCMMYSAYKSNKQGDNM